MSIPVLQGLNPFSHHAAARLVESSGDLCTIAECFGNQVTHKSCLKVRFCGWGYAQILWMSISETIAVMFIKISFRFPMIQIRIPGGIFPGGVTVSVTLTAVASSIPGFTDNVFTRDYSLVYSLGNSTLFLTSQFANSVTELVSKASVTTSNYYLSKTFTWTCAPVNGLNGTCVQCPVTAQTTSQENGVVTYNTGTTNNLTLTFSENTLSFGCEYLVEVFAAMQYSTKTTILTMSSTSISSNVIQPSADWTEATLQQVFPIDPG